MKHASPVAVLMCTYAGDSPDLLARSICSILSQTYNGEKRIYLCIDGPVPKKIIEVVCAYRNKIFHLIESEQNQGLASSLNLLIQALGDEPYVFRMDADDYAIPDRFIETISFMDEEKVDVCGSWIVEVHTETGRRKIVKYPKDHKSISKSMALGSPMAHPTVCFRKVVLTQFPSYPLKRSNEDIAFWFLLLYSKFRFGNVQKVLLEFSVNKNFFSRRSYSKAFEELQIYISGLYRLNGLSLVMFGPILRFFVRLLPKRLARCAYAMRWIIGR